MQLIEPGPESPPRRALRALVLLGFLLFLLAGPVCGLLLPPVRTKASVPLPAWDPEAFRLGRWMKDLERWLQERSAITYQLRGRYQEARWQAGLLEHGDVHVGRDGWFFLRGSLDADPAVLARHAPARRACLQQLKQQLDALGVAIVAVVAPDKPRLYPEFAYADGQLPATKAGLYALIRSELEAAGIPTVDALAELTAAKAASSEKLFYFRDSHWSAHAAVVVGRALRARIDALGLAHRLVPPTAFELMPVVKVHVVPDLVAVLGMRSAAPIGAPADSAVVASLMEDVDELLLWVKGEGGVNQPYLAEMTRAQVALCGTSYSDVNFRWPVAWFLGCLVDFRGAVPSGGPFRGLHETLARIRSGASKARLIVWEFVERMYLEPEWRNPPREF